MARLLLILKMLALVTLIGAGALLCAGLWKMRHVPEHVDGVLTRMEGVESKINASAINLDHATKAWADSAVVQADSVNALVQDARGTLSQARSTIAETAEHLNQTADAATGALNQARADLATANDTIAAAQPVLEASTRTVNHIDAEVSTLSPDLQRMIRASADTTEHVAGIADNTQKMTTRLEHDFDAKKPWWKRALPVITDAAKLAECFTRGNCF